MEKPRWDLARNRTHPYADLDVHSDAHFLTPPKWGLHNSNKLAESEDIPVLCLFSKTFVIWFTFSSYHLLPDRNKLSKKM
jgi:hypothetical protein